MPSPVAQASSLFQSILLSLGQFINHDNAIYISNYYVNTNILHVYIINEKMLDIVQLDQLNSEVLTEPFNMFCYVERLTLYTSTAGPVK